VRRRRCARRMLIAAAFSRVRLRLPRRPLDQIAQCARQRRMLDALGQLRDMPRAARRQLQPRPGFARRLRRRRAHFHRDGSRRDAVTAHGVEQAGRPVADFMAPGRRLDEHHQAPRSEQQRPTVHPRRPQMPAPEIGQALLDRANHRALAAARQCRHRHLGNQPPSCAGQGCAGQFGWIHGAIITRFRQPPDARCRRQTSGAMHMAALAPPGVECAPYRGAPLA